MAMPMPMTCLHSASSDLIYPPIVARISTSRIHIHINNSNNSHRNPNLLFRVKVRRTRAGLVGSFDSSAQETSTQFVKRMEQAWLISEQPRPVSCSSCDANGYVECKWCRGTGFFILGDTILCEIPSRNTTCVICAGKGSIHCSDCKGTGFRAKWLDQPPLKAESEPA